MTRRARILLSFLGLPMLLTGLLHAQSPIGLPISVDSSTGNQQGWQAQTILENGDLLVAWLESPDFQSSDRLWLKGRQFDLRGVSTETLILAEAFDIEHSIYNALVAPRMEGGFLLTFLRAGEVPSEAGCRAVAFDSEGRRLTGEIFFAPKAGCGQGLVALADGTFATAWYQENDPVSSRRRQYRMFARLSALGELVSRPRQVNSNPRDTPLSFGTLAGNASGDMTYIWGNFILQARSFSAYGGELPPLWFIRFADSTRPAVAVLPNGNRIFAGLNSRPVERYYVSYQRFAPDGTPLGRMKPAQATQRVVFEEPRLAADPAGNFAIAWTSPGPFCYRIEVRLFRADGTPVRPEIPAGLEKQCGLRPQISFAGNGTFAMSWVDFASLRVAWFSASPADEPCLTRGGRLYCDTGRTGGTPEIDQPDAPAAFDALFLADFDGDGRADPCFHAGTTFRCDLDHRGQGPGAQVQFGQATDLPLLGDVDGDGRAEACVRRGDLLACDTAHDGGQAEFEVHFGSPGGTALLGDLDGDHRDDLCLFRDGLFSCDTAHDGGVAERTVRFGQAGDLPVLGDFDGDGRDDPCVLRGTALLCDIKHDGGLAEASLQLAVQSGDGILLGNLDGL